MSSSLPARAPWLLAFVVVAAILHAATSALVRPMFQVSDEIGYFALAQQHALRAADSDATRERVMPDGRPFYNSPGGKPLFGEVAGTLLAQAARRLPSADAVLLMRLAISACHVAVVLATWCMARRLYPAHAEIAFVAAMFATWQPVLTSVNAGITPDAFANALSAWALYFVVLAFTARFAWLSLLAATLLAGLAFGFKDTALCVFAAVAWAAAVCTWRQRAGRVFAVIGAAALIAVAVGAASLTRSPYLDMALSQPLELRLDAGLVVPVAATLARNLVPTFVSFWATFGNFGAHDIFVSRVWLLMITAICGLALAGHLRPWHRGTVHATSGAAWWAVGAGIATSLLLHPLRVVLLHGVDDFQGRWLFPMAAAVMVIVAAGLRNVLATPRATAALGTLAATAIGVLPLVLVVVPLFYESFPERYDTASLYLQGVYGKGADPQRAMTFVAPLSAALVHARGVLLLFTVGAALSAACIGALWGRRGGEARGHGADS